MFNLDPNTIQFYLPERKEFNTQDNRIMNKYLRTIEEARKKAHLESPGILIQTPEVLKMYVQKAIRNGEYVLDVETTGLDTEEDIIVGVCLFTPGEKSAYVPMFHTDINGVKLKGQIDYNVCINILRELLESPAKAINHHMKFDHKMMIQNFGTGYGNIYWDTMIGAKLLNENEREHGLKYLYTRYVAKTKDMQKFQDLFKGVPFNFVPLDIAGIYGANDGYKEYQLYLFQKQWLNPQHKREDFRKLYDIFMNLEMPLTDILANMEIRGVEIRPEYIKRLDREFVDLIQEYDLQLQLIEQKHQEQIFNHPEISRLMTGGRINYNSPSQLQPYIYEILKFPTVDRRNPTGTGKEIQEKWWNRKLTKEQKLFLEVFQEYRKIDKLLKSFVRKIPKCLAKDNAVHTTFNQQGAKTGRFSSSHPIHRLNLQQIPSRGKGADVRKIFQARDGYVFVGSDFSQIEPRTLAKLCEDPEMLRAYREGQDLYSLMASRIYNKSYEECMEKNPHTGKKQPEGAELRSSVKSVLLGIMYGRSPQSIANKFGKTKKWAEQLIANFYTHYPNVKKIQMKSEYMAYKLGYVTTIMGRKRRLPEMRKCVLNSPAYCAWARKCLNAIIQGSSADIMKQCMVNLAKDSEWQSLDAHMVLTIHDELICEIAEGQALQGARCLARVMKETGQGLLDMPMKCDVEITKVWYGEDLTDTLKELENRGL